jgi:hypothetical protein
MGGNEMANVCACGCGGELPEGSTRQYKRGHKNRDVNEVPDTGFNETDLNDSDAPEPLTLDDAALQTPDDPEPKEQPEFKPRATIKVTAALRRDVEGKLAFAMALGGQVWIMADPICGSAFVDNTDNIAKKLTPIVCQSPEIVKWLTKSSNFILYIDLFMACWPVLQIIFAHHIAKSIELSASPNGQARPAANEYVVQ